MISNRSRYVTRIPLCGAVDTATGIRTPALFPLGPDRPSSLSSGKHIGHQLMAVVNAERLAA